MKLKNHYYLLRHGQTIANLEKRYQGSIDHPLTTKGQQQAREVDLSTTPDLIFTSPLLRASQTAQILASKYAISQVFSDHRLSEKFGGEIEGLTYEDIAQKYPECWDIWHTKDLTEILHVKFPHGESDSDVVNRAKSFLLETEKNYQQKTILLVTHSGVIQAFRYLSGKTKDEIYLSSLPECHTETFCQLLR